MTAALSFLSCVRTRRAHRREGEEAISISRCAFWSRARRDAMYAIYGFCRAVDDIADDEGDPAERRAGLDDDEGHRRSLSRPRRPALRRAGGAATAILASSAPISRRSSTACRWMSTRTFARRTRAKPILYCDRVASAVGRLSLRAFGYPPASTPAGALSEDASALAHHLGRALQLTNILRDLDEDCARGEAVSAARGAGQAAGDHRLRSRLRLWRLAGGWGQVCAEVAARSRRTSMVSWKIIAKGPGRAVKAPALMAAAYGSILDRLLARGFAAPRPRVSASKARVLLALLRYAFA